MKKFTQEQMKSRAIKRLAEMFFDHWEEGRVGSTRIFEHVIPDEWVIIGRSSESSKYREHVVPCALIRNQSIKMYGQGSSVSDVAFMIEHHLLIVLITDEERKQLDDVEKLKTQMPEGWLFSDANPYARLQVAGIEFA